jgi:hypothetical protein
LLCPLDEDSGRLTKQLVPFVGYKSIKLSSPKTLANSLFFVRDEKAIFSFTIDIQKQQQYDNKKNRENNKDSNTIFSVNDWVYSNNISIVKNTSYCFDLI